MILSGAAGDGKTDDSAAFQAEIDVAARLGGAEIEIPPVSNSWYYVHDLVVPAGVVLSGPAALGTANKDQTLLTVTGEARFEGLTFFGAGSLGATFDQNVMPTKPAVIVNAPGADNVTFRDCKIGGGAIALSLLAGGDVYLDHTRVSHSYGSASLWVQSQVWAHRSIFDQSPVPFVDPIPVPALLPWAPETSYPAGALALVGNYIIACLSEGKSGATAPALLPYYQKMADGEAQWGLAGAVGWSMVWLDSGSSENFFSMCDLSGFCWNNIRIDNSTTDGVAPAKALNMSQCIMSQSIDAAINAQAGSGLTLVACELGRGRLSNTGVSYGPQWTGEQAQIVAPVPL